MIVIWDVALMMETVNIYEMSVNIRQTSRRNVPESAITLEENNPILFT
jgi:hypothetical protein